MGELALQDGAAEGVDGAGAGEGGDGISSTIESVSLSPSAAGKKFWKRPFACHFDAFLNSIQTSMRPGRESAGSSRSRWFVVLREIQKQHERDVRSG